MRDNLFKLLKRGTLVVVPRPAESALIAQDTHWGMGHYGVLLLEGHGPVVAVLKACQPCARVKAGLMESGKELQPLTRTGSEPPMGGGFFGPLEISSAGNAWVILCIEHLTEWVELIPLPSKSSKDSARGLLEGAATGLEEVLMDQGREFMGGF